MATLQQTTRVDCPFSAAVDFANSALSERPSVRVSPIAAAGVDVNLATRATSDVSDTVRRHDALAIAWKPGQAYFPAFTGVLTVRPAAHGTSLRLHGRYEPPFGPAGAVFDAVAGRLLARRTLRRFLNELAADVERQWHDLQQRAG